ncbi:MAG TPA: exodeoxyribonuclease VII large subunit [Salinarimonas sp.]|nr:exodeoxyribonuclease VII large subunit [Salinarimonas sp.]
MNAPTNAVDWTVSELSGALKRTLEDAFGHVRVRGEISGYRGPHSSGHAYFCLKDQSAKLDAVIWKGTFARLKVKPQEGLEVVAIGRITTFPGKSSYQIVVDSIEPAGIGALMALLEERKRRLTAEGLFAPERKRPLPYLPTVIGVVTSPTGAVIRDILHRLEDRFPRRVLVWPVRVQGETCAAEVAAAIRGFNALKRGGPIPRPDVLIVARGGGSVEDLWGFNDEEVVRAAVESDIPLVSAVGHETDWTLIDHAADVRAPTPTGAAEMVVPVRADLVAEVEDLAFRHREAVGRALERMRADLRSAARALPSREALLAPKRQRLDLAGARLAPALARNARSFEGRIARLGQALERRSPRARLAELRGKLAAVGERPGRAFLNFLVIRKDGLPQIVKHLRHAMRSALGQRRQRFEQLGQRLVAGREAMLRQERERMVQQRRRLASLDASLASAMRADVARRQARIGGLDQLLSSLSYRSVLARGFALVRDGDGRAIRSAAAMPPGQPVELEFADGKARALAEGRAPRRTPRERAGGATQGDLF